MNAFTLLRRLLVLVAVLAVAGCATPDESGSNGNGATGGDELDAPQPGDDLPGTDFTNTTGEGNESVDANMTADTNQTMTS